MQPSIGGAAPGAPISAAAKAMAGVLAAKSSSRITAASGGGTSGSDTAVTGIGSLTHTGVTRVGSNTLSQDARGDGDAKGETARPESTGGEGDGYLEGEALPTSLSCRSGSEAQTPTDTGAAAARRAVGSGRKPATTTGPATLTPAKVWTYSIQWEAEQVAHLVSVLECDTKSVMYIARSASFLKGKQT